MKHTYRNRKRSKKSTQRKRRVLRAGAWFTGKSSTLELLNGLDPEQIEYLKRDMQEISRKSKGNPFFKSYMYGMHGKMGIIQKYSDKCHGGYFSEGYCAPFKTLVAAIADPVYYDYENNREKILAPIIVEASLSMADYFRGEKIRHKRMGVVPNVDYNSQISNALRIVNNTGNSTGGPPPSRMSTWI